MTFYTDNDSEVIGVYLRDRLEQGRTLPEALADSLADLDGAYNYLVASPEGLGIVRDRFGFKPLVVAETDDVRRRRHRGDRPPPRPSRNVPRGRAPDRRGPVLPAACPRMAEGGGTSIYGS